MQLRHTKNIQKIQNQHNKGTNDRAKPKGVESNTGKTNNTIGTNGSKRSGESTTGLDQTPEAGT